MRTTVRGYGGFMVQSWRDLGREGHGREYAHGSPYARQGIFVQGMDTGATRESGPGVSPDRRKRVENPGLKRRHDFVAAPVVCLTCHMLPEGHDRLMARLVG